MNNEALILAARAHRDQRRKGADIPYIVHPVEVAFILVENGADEELVSAGLLHDTLEDTDVTLKEIKERFGVKVAELVEGTSEPEKIGLVDKLTVDQKRASWKERKEHTIRYLTQANRDVKLVSCADKLSNVRSMVRDYKEKGNDLWKRFNASFEEQKWYYEELVKSLEDICEYKMYQELKITVDELFSNKKI